MVRAFALAEKISPGEGVAGVAEKDLREEDLIHAQEVMMVGTTLDVLPVTTYAGRPIGDGKVGRVAKKLLALLQADQQAGPEVWNLS